MKKKNIIIGIMLVYNFSLGAQCNIQLAEGTVNSLTMYSKTVRHCLNKYDSHIASRTEVIVDKWVSLCAERCYGVNAELYDLCEKTRDAKIEIKRMSPLECTL
jgi:hypothetical protein